ncbi:Uncharacterized protein At2g02148 [Linum grandiflorum]
MGSRVPVQHYDLRSPPTANSFIGSSLHDLNTVDSRPHHATIESIAEVDRHHPASSDTGLNAHGASVVYVSPIESARARFLQIIVDYFICDHIIEVTDSENDYSGPTGQDSLSKRKPGEVRYEGDPRFALPLMYVANMYETLVNDVNIRLASMNGIRDKTIGVALEAAGGLYRRMAKKFPKTVVDIKRFRRLTGRREVAVRPQDYKYYSPRHKCRRITTNIPGFSTIPGTDGSSTMVTDQGFRSP